MRNNMEKRLGFLDQQSRMIRDKKLTLERAVKYSYQAASISKNGKNYPALINRNKLIEDYDEKILSVDYQYNFKPGDIFTWKQNGSQWIIYLQDLTELAYFRGSIRKCNHVITKYNDAGGIEIIPAAVIGPKNSKINSIQKSQFNMDLPNYTISILIPKNNNTLNYFKRYEKFYLQDTRDSVNNFPVCWRIESVDSISLPGIIEVFAREYYINDDKDIIDNNGRKLYIANGKDQQIKNLEQANNDSIVGDTIIKPKTKYNYQYKGKKEGQYFYILDSSLPIKIIEKSNIEIELIWDAMYSGKFTLFFGDKNNNIITAEKEIIVDSLF